MDVRTGVRTASSAAHVSTDVHAEHLPVVLMVVHSVTSFLCQGVEIKQMTCRRGDYGMYPVYIKCVQYC